MELNIARLKELMDEKNLTLQDLSTLSGLSLSMLSRILTSKRVAGRRSITGIRKAFPNEPLESLFLIPNSLNDN